MPQASTLGAVEIQVWREMVTLRREVRNKGTETGPFGHREPGGPLQHPLSQGV